MKRQEWRRFLKSWRKIPCFQPCETEVKDKDLHVAHCCDVKVSDDMLFHFVLDMYKRWFMIPLLVVDGFLWRSFRCNVGVASDEWFDEQFGYDDEDFDLWLAGCE